MRRGLSGPDVSQQIQVIHPGSLEANVLSTGHMTVGRWANALTGGLSRHMSGSGRALAVLLC